MSKESVESGIKKRVFLTADTGESAYKQTSSGTLWAYAGVSESGREAHLGDVRVGISVTFPSTSINSFLSSLYCRVANMF